MDYDHISALSDNIADMNRAVAQQLFLLNSLECLIGDTHPEGSAARETIIQNICAARRECERLRSMLLSSAYFMQDSSPA